VRRLAYLAESHRVSQAQSFGQFERHLQTDETGKKFVYDARGSAGGGDWRQLNGELHADALGRRIQETVGASTTDLYYSTEWQLLQEQVDSATKSSTYEVETRRKKKGTRTA
jgi:hypothetical protein